VSIKSPVIAGVDYSITSPAITLSNNSHLRFFFFVDSPKRLPEKTEFDQFTLYPSLKNKNYINNIDRYQILANWAVKILIENKIDTIFLEGYSMGSRAGLAFNIGEATSLLKYFCFQNKIDVFPVPPTTVKKFATGKGNAKKEQMETAFIEQTKINLRSHLIQTEKQLSPSSDIIDSYYIFQYGKQMINETGHKPSVKLTDLE